VTIRFQREAEAELEEAVAFLNNRRGRAGINFLEKVIDTLALIATHDLIGHRVNRRLRRFSMPDWPYSIVYRPELEGVFVIAVAHEARRPNYWRSRLRRV
jgi:plasmid stabilization system protein ParE